MTKRGDTLVEVTLAIGIFSMVAVAVVALVNNSTSSAQTALEITLAREEIDVQAEALRFIHDSYVATLSQSNPDPESTHNYGNIWEAVVAYATEPKEEVLSYSPATCAELYDEEKLQSQGAFIINPSKLNSTNPDEIVISANKGDNTEKFHTTPTYPHLIYAETGFSLIGQSQAADIDRIEGIYVVAVEDSGTTIVGSNGTNANIIKKSAFYDFYIRTCWYGIGAKRPSTISTVIRLYNPAI